MRLYAEFPIQNPGINHRGTVSVYSRRAVHGPVTEKTKARYYVPLVGVVQIAGDDIDGLTADVQPKLAPADWEEALRIFLIP